jgi:hypothetical protein
MLDGEHVYEYDFSGMHVHLLYSLVGLKLGDKEPYILPKNDEHSNMRRVYKLIMLTSVNCKSDKECIAAVIDQLTDDMEQEPDKYPSVIPDLEAMLKELRKHHAPITRFINSSTGLPLQYIDSSIAEHVIIRMTAKSIPVLCIHDSFICKVSDASIVHQAMKTAFIEIVTMNLKDTNYVLKISAEEVFTSECNESQVKFPAYRRLTNPYNILRFALVFNNGYARRKLNVLATGVKEFNEVITPNMRVEYY